MKTKLATIAIILALVSSIAVAHQGRRFEIEVLNNQLIAQGINSGSDDGAPPVRPYYNSIHDHWANIGDGTARAVFPELDLYETDGLLGHNLFFELKNGFKWSNPPLMPSPGTVPDFQPLEANELISVLFGMDSVSTSDLGKLTLSESVDAHGFFDLAMQYTIGLEPIDSIYILEWELGSSAPGILNSDPVYILLSPDGTTPEERLHHASLYAEQYLGISSVPEPGAFAVLAGLMCLGGLRRRRV